MATAARLIDNPIPSSSPAFGTPVHPFLPSKPLAQPAFKPTIPTVLPILLPPPILRPLAFRTFTKKHNLTLGSSALQALATFIGRHCGSGWREEGTGEKVLEEVARMWKKSGGTLIVEDNPLLKSTLKTLETSMTGGRVVPNRSTLSKQSSFAFADGVGEGTINDTRPATLEHQNSLGLSRLDVEDEDPETEEAEAKDPRAWVKVVDAFTQPRLTYNMQKKHFERLTAKPSLLPPPNHKTIMFRDRYNLIHQRVLRNPAFQTSTVNTRTLSRSQSATQLQNFKITPVANLLGRSGSTHLLLGLLTVTPTGTLALSDLTGAITLDLAHAKPFQSSGTDRPWICPGSIVLVEGIYQEEFSGAGSSGLGGGGGVGGTIGGKFIGFSIGTPPVERRHQTLGITSDVKSENNDAGIGGGFGWTDFLGLGSEKAMGTRMRRLEKRLLGTTTVAERRRMIMLGEVNLDDPTCLEALRKIFSTYSAEMDVTPLSFVLIGNFVSHAAMAGADTGSIEYKEYFNDLATVLADYPSLLRNATFVFVPGDNDPWASAFSAGASTVVPRKEVPSIFTSRIKRAFANAKAEGPKREIDGEAIWASNPARLTLFGSAHEIVVFRDDISGRLKRTAITFGKAAQDDQAKAEAGPDAEDIVMSGAPDSEDDVESQQKQQPPPQAEALDHATAFARKLILSVLPQAYLSPFPLSVRPVHWDYASALSLYPLPHTLVLADAECPAFAITYEGCHVINPGRLVREEGKRKRISWVEYDVWTKRGEVKEVSI
ncbi:hypothetical protein MBLNU457_7325t1 [Dothideomycetes sp. NU457]